MTVQQDNATVEQEAIPANPLDEILKLAGEEPEEEAPSEDDEELEPEDESEGDEPEEEDEGEEDSADEPQEAIKPPVSLNKEQRAAFEQLPPELQKVWAETEAQRNEQVRQKTTEAAEATRSATQVAQAQLAAIQQQYAAELEVYAQAFQPVKPDYALLATDPAAYAQQTALYEQMSAQYEALMQQAGQARGQAQQVQQQVMQQSIEAEQALLKAEWPEILDPAKQADLWNNLVEVGADLGFNPENLSNSSASEMLALKKASEWRAKAAKWDAFQSSKMNKVRAAKNLPRVATPGTAAPRSASKADKAAAAFNRARQSKSGADYAEFLEAAGISL